MDKNTHDGQDINQGLKLLVDTSQPTQNPLLKLQWCLMPETTAVLREKRIEEPCLLLAVVDNRHLERRWIIPLYDLQALIPFNRPGRHTIHARIVWGANKGIQGLKNQYLCKDHSGRDYESNIWNGGLNSHGEWITFDQKDETNIRMISNPNVRRGVGLALKAVEISGEFFAPEPPAWERWWVNLWHENKSPDQCTHRKRRALAYSLQPPLVGIWIIFITIIRFIIATFLLLCVARGINWKAVIHPFRYRTSNVFCNTTGSFLLHDEDENLRTLAPVRFVFMPILPLSFFLLFLVLGTGVWTAILSVLAGLIVLAILIFLAMAIGASGPFKSLLNNLNKWREKRDKIKYERFLERFEREQEALSCELRTELLPINELPLGWRRTPRLFYQHTKAHLCKLYPE